MLASIIYLYSVVVLEDHGERKAFLWEEHGLITVSSSQVYGGPELQDRE